MAAIWPAYEGKEPTGGGPWARIPLSEAIGLFELNSNDFVSPLTVTPRFGDAHRDLWHRGYKHVLVEVEESEARREKWKSGFYRSKIKPKEAFRRLIEQPFVAEFGRRNVVRVDTEPAVDSQGRNALRITVVIAPTAVEALSTGAPLDASVRLKQRLGQMPIEYTPIIEYVTEAELKQDGVA